MIDTLNDKSTETLLEWLIAQGLLQSPGGQWDRRNVLKRLNEENCQVKMMKLTNNNALETQQVSPEHQSGIPNPKEHQTLTSTAGS